MIKLEKICKSYTEGDKKIEILKNISYQFPSSGFVFITGKSGEGKSTLLNIIGGLDRQTSGDVFFNNQKVDFSNDVFLDSYRNTYVGFIFQEFNLINEYSVKKNIELALDLQSVHDKDEKIDKALKYVSMLEHKNKYISELSGGQKQRIAIARSLVKDSEIIIADEPTGNLDSKTSEDILNIFKDLSKDKLIIMVTHNKSECLNYADIVLEVNQGTLREAPYTTNCENDNVIELNGKLDNQTIDEINNLISGNQNVYVVKSSNNLLQMRNLALSNTLTNANELVYIEKEQKTSITSKFPFIQTMSLAKDYILSRKIRSFFAIILFSISIMLFSLGFVISTNNYDDEISTALKSNPDVMFEVGVPKSANKNMFDYIGYDHYSKLVEKYPDTEFGIKFTDGLLDSSKISTNTVYNPIFDAYFPIAEVFEHSVNVDDYDFLPFNLVAGDLSATQRGTYVIPDFFAKWIIESGSYSKDLSSYEDLLYKPLNQILDPEYNWSSQLNNYMIIGIYDTGLIPTLESIVNDEIALYTVDSLANYYSFCINSDPYTNSTTEFIPVVISGSYEDKYDIATHYYTYDSNDLSMIQTAREVFADVSVVVLVLATTFTILSILMMFQYISSSINEKAKSIGVLRALGGRQKDITMIFIIQSLIIIIISFILSLILLSWMLEMFNYALKSSYVSNIDIFTVTVFTFSFISIFTIMSALASVLIPLKEFITWHQLRQ